MDSAKKLNIVDRTHPALVRAVLQKNFAAKVSPVDISNASMLFLHRCLQIRLELKIVQLR